MINNKKFKKEHDDVINELIHSKEENEPILIRVRLMALCIIIVIPPPLKEIGMPKCCSR